MDRSRIQVNRAVNALKLTGWPPKKRSAPVKISFASDILRQYSGRSIRLIESYVA